MEGKRVTKERIPERFRSLMKSRKLRCGAYSVLLTGIAIALVLLLIHLASLLEDRFALTADYSFNALTVQSEATESVLKSLQEDVHITYVHTNAGMTESSLSEDDVIVMLNRYRAGSPRLSWSEENIVQNPAFREKYKDQLTGREMSANCLVIECPATGRVRVLDENDFVTRSYELESGEYRVTGYTVEKSLTEALLYVSSRTVPTVQVLSGHAELTTADLAHMISFLSQNNYDMTRVTALDELDSAQPLLIACPQFDLTEEELNALIAFAEKGGTFLVLSRYSDPDDLTRFSQLYLYFGLRILPGLCVADAEDTASYYSSSPAVLAPYMQAVPELMQLIQSRKDYLLLTGARAFEILPERDSSIFAESLLKSGDSYLHAVTDGQDSLERGPEDPAGYFDLAVYARRYYEDRSSSRMIMIGNADLFCEEWLMDNTYSPEFLLAVLYTLDGGSRTDLQIIQKPAVRAPLRAASMTVPAVIALLMPFAVFVFAVIILGARRNL